VAVVVLVETVVVLVEEDNVAGNVITKKKSNYINLIRYYTY